MSLWLCAFVIAAVGAIFLFLRKRWHKPQEADKPRCYGHPRPPTEELRKKLPNPPSGHAWETKVTTDDGAYWMHLAIVNVVSGESVAATKSSLTRRNSYSLWADSYRRYGCISNDLFYEELIGPMADWAEKIVTKLSGPNTFEYKLG